MFKHLYWPNTFKGADLKTSEKHSPFLLLSVCHGSLKYHEGIWGFAEMRFLLQGHNKMCPCRGLREQGPLDNSLEYTVVLLGFLAQAQTAVHGPSEQKIWKSRSLLGSIPVFYRSRSRNLHTLEFFASRRVWWAEFSPSLGSLWL